MELAIDNYCFACGKDNPIGLHMHFEYEQERAIGSFTPRNEHQGFAGIVHGGILSTVLDEAMAHAIIAAGFKAVTARMEIQFKKPTSVGTPVVVTGQVVARKGKILQVCAEINQNDMVTVKANASFYIMAAEN